MCWQVLTLLYVISDSDVFACRLQHAGECDIFLRVMYVPAGLNAQVDVTAISQ